MPISQEATERMITRVARAIATCHGDRSWRTQVLAARAAVAAMREPTAEMLDAAMSDLPDWGFLQADWQAMIDYVISEPLE